MNESRSEKIYEFEDFRLDAAHLLLYRNGREISLAPKVVGTLLALVERSGAVVRKDDLMKIVWADSIVEENNLSQNLYILRKTLSETADGKPLIETLRRRGYRFNGDVSCVEPQAAEISSSNKNQSAARRGDVSSSNKPEISDSHFQTVKPADAFEACQIARILYEQATLPNFIKSRALLEEAVRLEADYAPAYIQLAEQCVMETVYGFYTPAEGYAKARDSLRRAADLGANSAEFYAATGFVNLVCDWNFAAAEQNLQKSLQLNPRSAFANNYLGQVFLFQRRFDKAEIYLHRSAQLETLGYYNRGLLGISYFLAREYKKAVQAIEQVIAIHPQAATMALIRCWSWEQTGGAAEAVREYAKLLSQPHGEYATRWIGYAYALVGDEEKARQIAAALLAESREHHVSPIHQAMIYAALNEPDEAFFHLENALAQRDPWMLWIASDPRLDNLRTDSRFQRLENSVVSAHAASFVM